MEGEAMAEQFDEYIPGDSETQGWEDEQEFIPGDEFAERLQEDQWEEDPNPMAAYWEQEQVQLQNQIGRPLNDTELMALNNAIDNGATGSLQDIYNNYQEVLRTPDGKAEIMKARLQELRGGGS
jgi:hypothetical protein